MSGDFFDTDVLLYLVSGDVAKADRAEALMRGGGGMSVQVLNAATNAMRRKLRLEWQEAWLEARAASGDFASVEEAARRLIAERIAELSLEESDDMAWARPYVDEALAEVERGEVITTNREARNDARLARTARRRGSCSRRPGLQRISSTASVIARSPCDEAIQGPRAVAVRRNAAVPEGSSGGPWIASLRSQ